MRPNTIQRKSSKKSNTLLGLIRDINIRNEFYKNNVITDLKIFKIVLVTFKFELQGALKLQSHFSDQSLIKFININYKVLCPTNF